MSGKLLVFTKDGAIYDYDAMADVWTQKASSHPFTDSYGYLNAVAAPIPEHGVVMLMKFNFDQSAVYLYKHSARAATPPPSVTLAALPTTCERTVFVFR